MRFREIAPPEVASGAPRLICTGRQEAVIEGHRGLFSYETACIRVRTGQGIWTVSGSDLTIDYFGAEDMRIRGRVDEVKMDGEG